MNFKKLSTLTLRKNRVTETLLPSGIFYKKSELFKHGEGLQMRPEWQFRKQKHLALALEGESGDE